MPCTSAAGIRGLYHGDCIDIGFLCGHSTEVASEASAKFSLWVSNGEKVDLMSSFPLDLGTCIANNSVVQLDDLLSEHAPYISSLDKRYLGSKYNGGIYGIPVMQRTYGAVGGIVVRNDIMKEVGLNYSEEKTSATVICK